MTNILITGANGFIGSALVLKLAATESGVIRIAVRQSTRIFPDRVEVLENLELSEKTDWAEALKNIDVVIHCAARAHLLTDSASDPLAEFRKVNTASTLTLAKQAVAAGVQRFIFISSLGVNGAETVTRPFSADDAPQPHSPYAQSKFEAESGLIDLSQATKMTVVVIRPPLVYGPHAPGNFGVLMQIVKKRIPLPLGRVANKRSFVFLDNLVDLISLCVLHPKAANQTFLVSDDEDLSTTELLRKMGNVFNKPALLVPVPIFVLKTALELVGKAKMSQQLLGSLQVDIQKTKSLLAWSPPFTADEGLLKTAGLPKPVTKIGSDRGLC
jgi:nucleoside-diphosphate-sugar epimerase